MSKLSKICKNKIKIRSKISSKDLKDFSKNLRLKTYDQNFFYLNDKSFGRINDLLLKFKNIL